MTKEELIRIATEARNLSYSPYSNFAVGAALLCRDGEVYVGTNIENSSYPLTMCAERTCLYSAMASGKQRDDFIAFAVVADTEGPCSPCGACRQVLQELFPNDAPIYLANLHGTIKTTCVTELLPFAFDGGDL